MDKPTDDLTHELLRFIALYIEDARRLSRASRAEQLRAAALALAEQAHLKRALTACGGNRSQAARLLQIDRRSLQRKLARVPKKKSAKKGRR